MLTAQIHKLLTASSSPTRSELLESPQYVEAIVGPWAILAWDTEMQVSRVAKESWLDCITWDVQEASVADHEKSKVSLTKQESILTSHISRAITNPASILQAHSELAPSRTEAHTSGSATPLGPEADLRDAKNRDENVEETVEATAARLAAGALGMLAWAFGQNSKFGLRISEEAEEAGEQLNDELDYLLHSEQLWACVSPSDATSSTEDQQADGEASSTSLGKVSPAVRARMWQLISALLSNRKPLLSDLVHTESRGSGLLEAAWLERDLSSLKAMLEAVTPLLIAFRDLWGQSSGEDAKHLEKPDEDESEEDDEDEDDEDHDQDTAAEDGQMSESTEGLGRSKAYQGFLSWLEAACGNAPALGFPAVIVLVSTLVEKLLSGGSASAEIEELFSRFYGALKSRAIDANPAGARAFIGSFCETLIFVARRAIEHEQPNLAKDLTSKHVLQIWRQLVLAGAKLQPESISSAVAESRVQGMSDSRLSAEVGKLLTALCHSKRAEHILAPTLEGITASLKELIAGDFEVPPIQAISLAISTIALLAGDATALPFATNLLHQVVQACQDGLEWSEGSTSSATVSLEIMNAILKKVPEGVLQQPALSSALATISRNSLSSSVQKGTISVSLSAQYLASYLPLCRNQDEKKGIWIETVSTINKLPDLTSQADVLVGLFSLAGAITPEESSQTSQSLHSVALAMMTHISETHKPISVNMFEAAHRLMSKPAPFVDAATADEMLTVSLSKLEYEGRELTSEAIKHDEGATAMIGPLANILEVVRRYVEDDVEKRTAELSHNDALQGVIPVIFNLAFLCGNATGKAGSKAQALWKHFASQPQAQQLAVASLQEHLLDVLVPLQALENALVHLNDAIVTSMLPSSSSYFKRAEDAFSRAPAVELSVLDSFIPQDGQKASAPSSAGFYDADGLGPYTRSVLALQKASSQDAAFLPQNTWALQHFFFLAIAVEDMLNCPSSASQLFSSATSTDTLTRVLRDLTNTLTGIVSSSSRNVEAAWHTLLAQSLQGSTTFSQADIIGECLHSLQDLQDGPLELVASRAFSRLLKGCLRFSSTDEKALQGWLKYGQSLQTKMPAIAVAVVAAVQSEVEGTQVYDRACNEAAARLSGIPPNRANEEGLHLLRYISVLAPPANSDVAFIPQQRALFVLQNMQKWVASEEDLAEEINARLAHLGTILLPIVQDMPGSHLDFLLDLTEANLEASSLEDYDSFPCLYHSLQLLATMRDLAATNATVREVWKERKTESLEIVRSLFLSMYEGLLSHSSAKEACVNLLIDLSAEIPQTAFRDEESSKSLSKLLLAPNEQVQITAYRRLSAKTRELVADLVVQAALAKPGTEAPHDYRLPIDILANISNNSPIDLLADANPPAHRIHAFFLSWLVIFDHFEGASLQLSSRYMEDLQRRDLVASNLLPSVFGLCGDSAVAPAIDSSLWNFDEVFLDYLEVQEVRTWQVLAAHLFFRALVRMPTLVRSWWFNLRDRQLSTQVERFTSRYCTPLVAARELQHLTESDALSKLQDENMSVKILSTNEVVATYTVDEHPMEIAIKIPADFPLHSVEIKDIKRVGVSESQWRAWILAVQQLITSKNGLVFDALMLFKRNVEAKFAGYEGAECESKYRSLRIIVSMC